MALGSLGIMAAMVVESMIVLAAARIARGPGEDSRVIPWLQRVFGGVLIAPGIRVVMSAR